MTTTASATTILDITSSLRPAPTGGLVTRTRRADVGAVPAAIRSEWIKLRSLRSTWMILGLTALVGVVMSWVLGAIVKTDPYEHLPFTVANTFMTSTLLTSVLTVIVGILMFTSEVQHGTISNAIAARPARWVTVAGKSVVAAAAGLAMGVVGIVACFAGGMVSGMDMGDTSGVAATTAWALLLTTLAGMLGVGIGMIVRHSAAAVSTALVWTFVIENLVRNVASVNVSRFLPFSAAGGLLSIRNAGDTAETLAAALGRPQDAFLFAAFTAAALVAGTVLLYRRDAD